MDPNIFYNVRINSFIGLRFWTGTENHSNITSNKIICELKPLNHFQKCLKEASFTNQMKLKVHNAYFVMHF